MMIFWITSVVLVALALALVLPPLLRSKNSVVSDRDRQNIAIARDRLDELKADLAAGRLTPEQYEETRAELELDLYHNLQHAADEEAARPRGRWAAIVVGLGIPLVAGTLYLGLGNVGAVNQMPTAQQAATSQLPAVEEMVAMLAERMKSRPDDLKGWIMLGRSYKVLDRYPDAAAAFEQAWRLAKDNPDVMLQYADALAMARDGNLAGKPMELVMAALELRPDDLTGLWLAGMAEAQQGDFAEAVEYWKRARGQLADDPKSRTELDAMIAEAERRAGIEPSAPAAASAAAESPSVGDGSIQVEVSLAPELVARAAAGDTLFVYAQAINGPPMPLAIVRKKVSDLPLAVTLSDAMAMMPAAKLSNYGKVRITARISKTANAMPQAGDLVGRVEPVAVGAGQTVRVVIDGEVS